MRPRVEAIITPELLVWARRTIGLDIDEVAHRIRVKPDRLGKWETGELKPSINQIRAIASVYKRPVAAFYLPKPPKDMPPIHDFRRLPDGTPPKIPPSLLLEVRRAHLKREVAIELSELLGEGIPPFTRTAAITDDIDSRAESLRTFLNVKLKEQLRWKDEYRALNSWKEAIERQGVLVFQATEVPDEVMSGFSISEEKFPVIVVNIKDFPRRKIFTMLHEFGHLLLHNAGLCELRGFQAISSESPEIEVYCNKLAGAILVPKEALLLESTVVGKGSDWEWQDVELVELANKFQVSREVILRRLLTLGRTTPEYYNRKRQEYAKIVQRLKKKKIEGFQPPSAKSVSSNGFPYIRLVLNAYYRDNITASEVSDFLGVRLKHLPKIEERVLGPGGTRERSV